MDIAQFGEGLPGERENGEKKEGRGSSKRECRTRKGTDFFWGVKNDREMGKPTSTKNPKLKGGFTCVKRGESDTSYRYQQGRKREKRI